MDGVTDLRRFLSCKEASQRLGITTQTLRNWRRRERGPNYLMRTNRYLYDPDVIEAWITQQYRQPGERR